MPPDTLSHYQTSLKMQLTTVAFFQENANDAPPFLRETNGGRTYAARGEPGLGLIFWWDAHLLFLQQYLNQRLTPACSLGAMKRYGCMPNFSIHAGIGMTLTH